MGYLSYEIDSMCCCFGCMCVLGEFKRSVWWDREIEWLVEVKRDWKNYGRMVW